MNFAEQRGPEMSGQYEGFMNDYISEWQNRYREYEKEMADPQNAEETLQQKYLDVLKEMDISGDLS